MRRFRFRMITVQIHPALQWGLALSIVAVLVLWMAQSYYLSGVPQQSASVDPSATATNLERPRLGWADLLRLGIPAVRLADGPDQPSALNALGSLVTSTVNVQLTDPRTYLSSQIPMLLTVPRPTISQPPANPPPGITIPLPTEDVDPLPPERTQPADTNKPSILIYHTHNAEAYQGTSKEIYVYNDDAQTVIRVGDELEKELTKLGIGVIHDKTHHMDKDFNASYLNSRRTAQEDLKKNTGLKMIIDLHRDGTEGTDLSITTTKINQEPVARVMIVLGTNPKLGVTPDYSKNEAFAKALHKKMDELYPGLSRGVYYEPLGRYNQDLSPNALLLEIGGNLNSMEEALRSARYLARVLAEVAKTR